MRGKVHPVAQLRLLLQPVKEAEGTLTREQSRAALALILEAPESDAETDQLLAALLTRMAQRGETAAELTGFAEAMRAAAIPLPLTSAEREQLVDTCGTGGDGLGTFNISTGAALVAAAAGAKVAKHGNRAVTSRTGSADVLESLGVPIGLSPEQSVACLRATGFMFLLATALHPSMRRVAPVRRALGFRTIFNLAGPLTNPAGARAQVMGVWDRSRLGVAAETMSLLGVRHAFVVHGESGSTPNGGLDELTVTGPSHGVEVRAASGGEEPTLRRFVLEPEELGLDRASLGSLGGGGSAEESAAVLMRIFQGEQRGAARDVVLLNAAAALVAGGVAGDLADGLARAAEAVDRGAVLQVLARLQAFGR